MNATKTAAAALVLLALCAVPVLADGLQASDLPYTLTGEVPEFGYTGQETAPTVLQTITPAPGYTLVSSGLIGGDVVPAPGGAAEAPPFGYIPKPQTEVGIYRLVYETVLSGTDGETEYDITLEWRIVPGRVDVTGHTEKVFDGTVSASGGISLEGDAVPDTDGLRMKYATADAGASKDIVLEFAADVGSYEFFRGDVPCTADGGRVTVPDAGSISRLPATVTGDPDREYDGTDVVHAELAIQRAIGLKVESARFLDVHAGTGVGIEMTFAHGSPSNFDLEFRGVRGTAEGDRAVFEGTGDILQRSVSPVWHDSDHHFYTGDVLELPTAEAFGAVDGETVLLRTECVPADLEFREVGEYRVAAVLDGGYPDYVVTNAIGYTQIDPAPLEVAGSADREYDGTVTVRGVTVEGAAAPLSVEFEDEDAGTGKAVLLRYADGYARDLMFSYTDADGVRALGKTADGGGTVILENYGSIAPREASLVWTAPPSLTYSGEVLAGPSVTVGNLAGDDVLEVTVRTAGGLPFMDAGTYLFVPSVPVPDRNYVLPPETMEYTVGPAVLDVAWNDVDRVYDGTEQAFPTAEPLGLLGEDTAVLEVFLLGSSLFSDAGTYVFEAVSDNPNYTVSDGSMHTSEISGCPLALSGTAGKVFDGTAAFGGTVTMDGAADGIEVTGKRFADPSAGEVRDVVVTFSPGTASNYAMTWDGTPGTCDGDEVVFPGIGKIAPRPIDSGDIGGRFVQTGDELRLFVAVSSGTLVCTDFTWTSGGEDRTGTGVPVSGGGPVDVEVSAVPGSDWTGTASASLAVDASYTVTVLSGDDGNVSGDSVKVTRGTPISSSGSVLTVGDTVFEAAADSGYAFDSWTGVPYGGRVDSDLTVAAMFAAYVPPEPPPVRLISLDVTVPPDRVSYTQGDAFDPTGMKAVASYSDGSRYAVTAYTWSPEVLVKGGPAVEVTVSYAYVSTAVFVKVEGAVPTPPLPVVDRRVDVPVDGDTLSDVDAAAASACMDEVRAYDPALVPEVTVHTETSETFTVPSSLYASVRENGAWLKVGTATGSVSMRPGSLPDLEIPGGGMTVGIVLSESSRDRMVYEITLSSDGTDIPVTFSKPADAVLRCPAGWFGDGSSVLADGAEIGDVTYSEIGGQALVAFPVTCGGTVVLQKEPEPEPGSEGNDWTLPAILLLILAAVIAGTVLVVRDS